MGALTVLANLSGQARTWPGESGEILLTTGGEPGRDPDGVTLAPLGRALHRPLAAGRVTASAGSAAGP